jgi:mRNA-degrading endonuclease toxin of MazEF toxin-antitoxin module
VQRLERGHIVATEVLDPQHRNPKVRPVVIVTPTPDIEAGLPCFGVAITGQLPKPLSNEFVLLPFQTGPRGHPRTGLKKSVCRQMRLAGADPA